MRKTVSRSAGTLRATSCWPHDFDQRSWPSTTRPTTSAGILRALNCSANKSSISGSASASLRARSWGSAKAGAGRAGCANRCAGTWAFLAHPARSRRKAKVRIRGKLLHPVAALAADPLGKQLQALPQRRAGDVAQDLPRARHVGAGEGHVARLRGLHVQLGAQAERLLEQADEVPEAGRLRAAQVDDLVPDERYGERGQHACQDVVDEGVVAPG